MVTPQGIVLVIFGIFICFMGYSMFKSMMPIWGFILGGLVAINFGAPLTQGIQGNPMVIQILTFIAGGVVGALISLPLYYVSVFLTGAVMGGLMGIILGAYIDMSGGTVSVRAIEAISSMSFPPPVNTALQLLLLIVLGIITGGVAIAFQKFMISASTAFLGSAVLIAGLNTSALDILRTNPSKGIWMLVVWIVVGLVGLFVQYRMRDET